MNEVVFKYQGDTKFKGYYDSFMESLKDLSDEESQVKAWKNKDHDPTNIFSYSELYEEFLSSSEDLFDLYKEMRVSEKQLQIIKKLYHMVDNYNDSSEERDEDGWAVPKTDAQIADDPEWHKI